MACGGHAAAPEEAGYDGEAEEADRLAGLLRSRDETGLFASVSRRQRTRQAPGFKVVEPKGIEGEHCWDSPSSAISTTCASSTKCAAHGGTLCQRW